MTEKLYFDKLKEDRGWYFVEYQPPIATSPFATVQLVVPGKVSVLRVAEAMESELVSWLNRYEVAVMVSSFDGLGELISLTDVRPCNHLIGWKESTADAAVKHWRLVANEEFPQATWQTETLQKIYRDVAFRTSVQLEAASRARRWSTRVHWWFVFMWVVAVPAGFALLEFNGPVWLAYLTFGYALIGAYIEALKLLGWWPETSADREKKAEELRMRHHHYHCERNPEGFERLKRENFEREARDEIRREAEGLKTATVSKPAKPAAAGDRRRRTGC